MKRFPDEAQMEHAEQYLHRKYPDHEIRRAGVRECNKEEMAQIFAEAAVNPESAWFKNLKTLFREAEPDQRGIALARAIRRMNDAA